MKQDRFQFFELKNHDSRMAAWEHQFFLDRITMQVYLPVVDPEEMILALMDNELIEVNGRPFCPLRLYVERYPHLSNGLLDLEARVRAEV